jgi:hypothetical protein
MRYQALLMVWVILAAAPALAEELPRPLKPAMVWTGTDSKQAKESFARLGSQKDWEDTWHKHRGRDKIADSWTCPEIDFDSYMVVAIFHGKSYQNNGIKITAVSEEKDLVRVRYKPTWYQVAIVRGREGDDAHSYDTQSYAFIVLPKSSKAILLEEDVHGINGEPPVWKERAKLAAPGK